MVADTGIIQMNEANTLSCGITNTRHAVETAGHIVVMRFSSESGDLAAKLRQQFR